MTLKRRYNPNPFPFDQDLTRFGPPYTPEKFTTEQKYFLEPFFTNLDQPVFIITNLPEEVSGALSSRYSRSTLSLRQMLWTEYLKPILYPQQEKNWPELTQDQKASSRQLSRGLKKYVKFLHSPDGKLDRVVNAQRGQKFFEKWLAGYGDDSIEELGGVHLCSEGISSLALEEAVNKRIGISPLVKSTRYVDFSGRRPDGEYQYLVPGEIRGTRLESSYKETLDLLFQTYTDISEPYLQYIMDRYPKEDDETDNSFLNSRKAKRFDDIRDLLPFATQNNVAMFGNGRSFEELITRFLAHPIGEIRWWGQAIANEMAKVVPSFVERPQGERGARVQLYRTNLMANRDEIANYITSDQPSRAYKPGQWVKLISATSDAEVEVLTAELFSASTNHLSYGELRQKVAKLSPKQRTKYLDQILTEREFNDPTENRQAIRFRKVPRSFEVAHFHLDLWCRAGDFRDLHRHRQNTELHPPFTVEHSYDLEKEVVESPFMAKFTKAFIAAEKLYRQLAKKEPYLAQYVVPFAYIQNWHLTLSAREIFWIVELRTGPQGRGHYREVCQQLYHQAAKATPALFQRLQVDMNDYRLSRRESEKRIEKKRQSLEHRS